MDLTKTYQSGNLTGRPVTSRDTYALHIAGWDAELARMFRKAVEQGFIDYVFMSYTVPLAWHWTDDQLPQQWGFNETRYSSTTTKHLNKVKNILDH